MEREKENEREKEEENEREKERQIQIQMDKERQLQIEKGKERLRRIRKKKEPNIDAPVIIMPKLNPVSKIISQEVLSAPPTVKWKDAAIKAVTTVVNCMATSNIESDDKLQLVIENDEFKNRYDKTKFYYYFNETPRYNINSVFISTVNNWDSLKLNIREFDTWINHVLKHLFLKIIKNINWRKSNENLHIFKKKIFFIKIFILLLRSKIFNFIFS